MRFTRHCNAKQRLLTAAVFALLPLGSIQAGDIYDDIRAMHKQSAEAQKRKNAARTDVPPAQADPAANDAGGARGPIRQGIPDDQPATEQSAPRNDEQSSQPAPDTDRSR